MTILEGYRARLVKRRKNLILVFLCGKLIQAVIGHNCSMYYECRDVIPDIYRISLFLLVFSSLANHQVRAKGIS